MQNKVLALITVNVTENSKVHFFLKKRSTTTSKNDYVRKGVDW